MPFLQSIEIQFLPPNTTSQLQPLDQGIIKICMTLYWKEIVRSAILDMEEQKSTATITLLQAIRMADKSWSNVTKETIINCYTAREFIVNAVENMQMESAVTNDL